MLRDAFQTRLPTFMALFMVCVALSTKENWFCSFLSCAASSSSSESPRRPFDLPLSFPFFFPCEMEWIYQGDFRPPPTLPASPDLTFDFFLSFFAFLASALASSFSCTNRRMSDAERGGHSHVHSFHVIKKPLKV